MSQKPKKEGGKILKGRERSDEERTKALNALHTQLRKEAEEEAERNRLEPGKLIPGQGVYIGTWELKDRQGNGLGKIFNVFAAPQNLTDASGKELLLTFNETVARVSSLKKWHGHDGAGYATDTELFDALKNGDYHGEWFIPTGEIMFGANDIDGMRGHPDNIFVHRNTGALKGTFDRAVHNAYSGYQERNDFLTYYWTCTEYRHNPFYMMGYNMYATDITWRGKDLERMRCRPVRLVEVGKNP